ncbi:hypothetical protein BJ742DRAFT_802452 [Cladochytrium replicatum]|nr:hypothetical protein BJ742DRAFT_802452 [Cladochytrium replicatum]
MQAYHPVTLILSALGALLLFKIMHLLIEYQELAYRYNMRVDLRMNTFMFLGSLIFGTKVFYCKQPLNATTRELLATRPRSEVAEWRIGMHKYRSLGIKAVPVTMDMDFHGKALSYYMAFISNHKLNLKNIINSSFEKVFEKREFGYIDLAAFSLYNVLKKKETGEYVLTDAEVMEFAAAGADVMKYVNSEIGWESMFPYMAGIDLSVRRKQTIEVADRVFRKYMCRDLFGLPKDIRPEDIDPHRAVMAMFFYGALSFSSINNLTGIMLALSDPKVADNPKRRERLLYDEVYKAEFIKEMIRIYAALPSIPRYVDGFEVIFTNVNRPVAWNFDWDRFDDVGVDASRPFDSFGFGRRQCAARGWVDKIYALVVTMILERGYRVLKVSEKEAKTKVAPWSVAFVKQPVFKLVR